MIKALIFGALTGWLSGLFITVYLHRSITHQALELHPAVAHVMRFWLWVTTGTDSRRWAAVHRKHHAAVDRAGDPHSPAIEGIGAIFFFGYYFYRRAFRDEAIVEKYGFGCPNDGLERQLYGRFRAGGLLLLLAFDIACFGSGAGLVAFLANCLWVPFWAISVINGLGHFVGYRNYDTHDASRNLWPLALLVAGEELHNNHHRWPRSARFSAKVWELDPGWLVIRGLSALGLAHGVWLPEDRLPHGPDAAAATPAAVAATTFHED
ncbi:MAG: fatty acid desaturase [Pseudomonadota bacterium]